MAEKLADLYEVLRKSRVSIISMLLVVGTFILVPQSQDILRTLAQPDTRCQRISFELLLIFWSLIVWYGARFLLDQDFVAMRRKIRSLTATRSLWGEVFLPRFLCAACLGGVGIAMITAVWSLKKSEEMHYDLIIFLGIANIILGGLFYFGLNYRQVVIKKLSEALIRRAGDERVKRMLSYNPPETRISAFSSFSPWLRWGLLAGCLLSAAIWLLVFFGLQTLAPRFGTATIVILAVVFITVFSTALTWFSERYKLPIIFSVICISGIFGLFNDNHEVRKKRETVKLSEDMTANNLFNGWLAKMDKKYGKETRHPMFIIAASGGGIKAAYWTASVLAELQKENNSFAEHAIIISPVSGGTLGALVFVSLAKDLTGQDDSLLEPTRAILSRDFLSPAIGSLFFQDIPAKLFPIPNLLPDRASALEKAWERAFDPEINTGLPKSPLLKGNNPFRNAFSILEPAERNHNIPTLLINGTVVETGQRILTTHLKFEQDFKDCLNIFEIRNNDIRVSTAAMMSARFTYVSPAGTLNGNTHVVDGGYYENSGATTAMQFYESIEGLLQNKHVIPYFIQIDNDYVAVNDVQRSQQKDIASKSKRIFPELSAPISALLSTRNAHAVSAEERIKRVFGDEWNGIDERYFHFTFSMPGDVQAPLGWYLSKASQKELNAQLENSTENIRNFERVRNILAPFNSSLGAGVTP